MNKEIKYKDYRIGNTLYTIKLEYRPNGGFNYNPAVRVEVMNYHQVPTKFFDKLFEYLRYGLNSYLWDPLFSSLSLNEYCEICCKENARNHEEIARAQNDWGQM